MLLLRLWRTISKIQSIPEGSQGSRNSCGSACAYLNCSSPYRALLQDFGSIELLGPQSEGFAGNWPSFQSRTHSTLQGMVDVPVHQLKI